MNEQIRSPSFSANNAKVISREIIINPVTGRLQEKMILELLMVSNGDSTNIDDSEVIRQVIVNTNKL